MKYLPCPFCGSKNINYNNDTGPNDEYFESWIECEDCGARAKNDFSWNRRVK